MQVNEGRRQFIKTASAAVATAALPILGANDRVNVGMVGSGRPGPRSHELLLELKPDCRIAAVCDVNQAARERAVALSNKLKNYDPKSTTTCGSCSSPKTSTPSRTTPESLARAGHDLGLPGG